MDKADIRCPMDRKIFEAIPAEYRPGRANNPMSLRELLAEVRQRHPNVTPESILREAEAVGFEVTDEKRLRSRSTL
jgi:hypothetical protein